MLALKENRCILRAQPHIAQIASLSTSDHYHYSHYHDDYNDDHYNQRYDHNYKKVHYNC